MSLDGTIKPIDNLVKLIGGELKSAFMCHCMGQQRAGRKSKISGHRLCLLWKPDSFLTI